MTVASLSEAEKTKVRTTLFHHLSGIVLAPTVKALADRKVFDYFSDPFGRVTLDQLIRQTHANRGYLRVALRLLACCGWLKQEIGDNGRGVTYSLTPEGVLALHIAPGFYGEVLPFTTKAVYLEDFVFNDPTAAGLPSFPELVQRSKEHWGIPFSEDELESKVHEQIRKHMDGVLVGPSMVALARGGVLDLLLQGPVNPEDLRGNPANMGSIFELLASQGWIQRERNRVSLTESGYYAAQLSSSYGVTVSYMLMFNVVSTLIFGNPRIPRVDDNGIELLVNRGMNVWGSGGAHKTYFKKVDEIVLEIFNRPIEAQPKGICDMGCGDGSFLEHLYHVVKNHTVRGKILDQHPLIIVGADFNKVARRVSKLTLRKAEIPLYHVIHGDINRPALLAGDLETLGLDIHDLLHVRSFLDHNRPYMPPSGYVKGSRIARCSGAFAHLGQEVLPDELEENLVRHLRRWAPYVGRFGLILLELHTLSPDLTAANLRKTPAVAYDGTHGFSDQYLVELPIFLDCVRESGMHANTRYQTKYPPSDLATVSINYFTTTPN